MMDEHFLMHHLVTETFVMTVEKVGCWELGRVFFDLFWWRNDWMEKDGKGVFQQDHTRLSGWTCPSCLLCVKMGLGCRFR